MGGGGSAHHDTLDSLPRSIEIFTAEVLDRSKSRLSRSVAVSADRMGPTAASTADPKARPAREARQSRARTRAPQRSRRTREATGALPTFQYRADTFTHNGERCSGTRRRRQFAGCRARGLFAIERDEQPHAPRHKRRNAERWGRRGALHTARQRATPVPVAYPMARPVSLGLTGSPEDVAKLLRMTRANTWAMIRPKIHAGMAYSDTWMPSSAASSGRDDPRSRRTAI